MDFTQRTHQTIGRTRRYTSLHFIIPHIESLQELLKKANQKALLIFDVFKGQTTGAVKDLLEKHKILLRYISTLGFDREQVVKVLFLTSIKRVTPKWLRISCVVEQYPKMSKSTPGFCCKVTSCSLGDRLLPTNATNP